MTEQHRADPKLWAAAEKWGGITMVMANCILELRSRLEALEAAQRAHIEAKAAEAGAQCAVEQLRSKPGSWQPLKVETTYGSDVAIPELSEHRAPDEWVGHHLATARALVRDIGNRPVTVEGSFDMGGQSYSYKTEAKPTLAADAQQLTLVERVADAIETEDGPIPAHGPAWDPESRAAIRVVAAWLRENPGPNSAWLAVARDLMDEANR